MGGLNKKQQERAKIVRERGPREDFGKKQEKSAVSGHLKKQLETAEQKLKTATEPKMVKKLKEIIANIESTLSK